MGLYRLVAALSTVCKCWHRIQGILVAPEVVQLGKGVCHLLPSAAANGARGSGRVAPQVVAASSVLLGPSRLRYSITVFASPGSSRCETWVNFQRLLFLTGGSKIRTMSNRSFGHLAGIVAFGSWLATRYRANQAG